MNIVTERVDAWPREDPPFFIERDEKLLFAKPGPPASNFLQKHPNLDVIHFDTAWTPSAFAPPRDVYNSEHARVEWQMMNARQPFYHRNADVDEISFHVSGKRTLITERGSVDLIPGDFARIPVFTAHDNYGIEDVHLIFYFPAPVIEQMPPSRKTEAKFPPFEAWEPKIMTEVITECLGSVGCDRASSLIDEERTLLKATDGSLAPININNAYELKNDSGDPQWFYKSPMVWLGSTTMGPSGGKLYYRHRCADEIQYQTRGKRTLVTQRGTVQLEPGDFVNIPLGTAYTSISKDTSTHLSLLTRIPPEVKAEVTRKAEDTTWDMLNDIRL